MDTLVKIYKKSRKETTVQDSGIKLTTLDRNVIEFFYLKNTVYQDMGISQLSNLEC